MKNCILLEKALDSAALYEQFLADASTLNYGAFSSFTGVIRKEGEINALSFDVDENMVASWFGAWCEKTKNQEIKLYFAHSIGLVKAGEVSYFAAIASRHRGEGLAIFAEFVEDFKQNAPIWKYDVINGEKIYAKERSFALPHAGLFS